MFLQTGFAQSKSFQWPVVWRCPLAAPWIISWASHFCCSKPAWPIRWMILARQKPSEVQISASGLAQSNHVNGSFNWLCSFSSDRDNQFSLKGSYFQSNQSSSKLGELVSVQNLPKGSERLKQPILEGVPFQSPALETRRKPWKIWEELLCWAKSKTMCVDRHVLKASSHVWRASSASPRHIPRYSEEMGSNLCNYM